MDQRPIFLGLRITPINRRRLDNFTANRRGFWSLWIFLFIFLVTIFAEFIANDKPLLVRYDGDFFVPVLVNYPETTFGGDFETEAEYSDPEVAELIEEKGWIVWPAPGTETVIQPYDWNYMLISVHGNRYIVYLNGMQMIDFTYPSPGATEGLIALQLHSGGEGRMRFKDIRIRDLTQ